ncbi:MAG: putative phosphoesterase [Saprospiraceae bacterium]
MKKILLLSDTHGFLDARIIKHIKEADEVWHAGDVGDIKVCDDILKRCANTKIVFGNIDNNVLRAEYKQNLFFDCEGVTVWITHIGGYPPKYRGDIKRIISENNIDLFVCGHSHILKVIYDKGTSCLHMNPGAIGKYGIHQVQTALKFQIEKGIIKDLNIIELERG